MEFYDLIIRSRDRLNINDSPNRFSINLRIPILNNKKRVYVKNVSMPVQFYNITNLNNVFIANISGTTRTVTITPGFYNITTLCAAIDTQLKVFSASNSCTYNTSLFLVQFSFSGSTIINVAQSTILQILGFNKTTYIAATSFNGDTSPNLIPAYVLLQISQLSSVTETTQNGIQGSVRIPLLAEIDKWNIVNSELLDNQYFSEKRNNQISNLTINLLDDNGNPFNIIGEWSFTLAYDDKNSQ